MNFPMFPSYQPYPRPSHDHRSSRHESGHRRSHRHNNILDVKDVKIVDLDRMVTSESHPVIPAILESLLHRHFRYASWFVRVPMTLKQVWDVFHDIHRNAKPGEIAAQTSAFEDGGDTLNIVDDLLEIAKGKSGDALDNRPMLVLDGLERDVDEVNDMIRRERKKAYGLRPEPTMFGRAMT